MNRILRKPVRGSNMLEGKLGLRKCKEAIQENQYRKIPNREKYVYPFVTHKKRARDTKKLSPNQ